MFESMDSVDEIRLFQLLELTALSASLQQNSTCFVFVCQIHCKSENFTPSKFFELYFSKTENF